MALRKEHVFVRRIIGANIARMRDEMGISQSEFARRFSIDRSHLNLIESGRQNASIYALVKIADGLDVPLTKLFVGLEGNTPYRLAEYAVVDLPPGKKKKGRLQ